MLYDLHNELHRTAFKARCNALYSKGGVVELTDRNRRTSAQNRYLHLILGWFAVEYGETVQYVKEEYFKRLVNADLFVVRRQDRWMGEVTVLRSTRDLTSSELSQAVDRFRDWSSREAGIYLPEANEDGMLRAIEVEVNRMSRYI